MKIILIVVLGLSLAVAQSFERDANGVYHHNTSIEPNYNNRTSFNGSSFNSTSNYSNFTSNYSKFSFNVSNYSGNYPFGYNNESSYYNRRNSSYQNYTWNKNSFGNYSSFSYYPNSSYGVNFHKDSQYNNDYYYGSNYRTYEHNKMGKGGYFLVILAVVAKLILFVLLVFILVKTWKNCRDRRRQQRYNRMRQPSDAGVILPVTYQMQQVASNGAGLYPQLPNGVQNNFVVGVPVPPHLAHTYMANRPQQGQPAQPNQPVQGAYPHLQPNVSAASQNNQQSFGVSQAPPNFSAQHQQPIGPQNFHPGHFHVQHPPQVYNYPQMPANHMMAANYPHPQFAGNPQPQYAGNLQAPYQYPKINE